MQTQSLGNAPKELNLQRWSLTAVSLPGSSVLGGSSTQLTPLQGFSAKIPLQAHSHGAIPITESSGTLNLHI